MATFLDEVAARTTPAMHRAPCAALPHTGTDGEAVLGMIVKDKLMPVVVDDRGVLWLSLIRTCNAGGCKSRTVVKAARRLGLAAGVPRRPPAS